MGARDIFQLDELEKEEEEEEEGVMAHGYVPRGREIWGEVMLARDVAFCLCLLGFKAGHGLGVSASFRLDNRPAPDHTHSDDTPYLYFAINW